ncbi:MAG: prepilin-type N-terminal cleavage/methylation domain-containing protein [Coleofasciculaceae cyanobacterium SM2_3_26]|nr:prepilin-type N-terminal cleavage/methylation domain-containing protein [Coleofasciculaceae cyanobacterium SM2_3_26]
MKSLSKRLVQRQGISLKAGFTMIELLVAILISGVLVTGLMAIVIELLSSNQRETVRTETQQEMQAALEFIASEMREAVYIYDGGCLEREPARTECAGLFGATNPGRLPVPQNSVPILAFWKVDPLPDALDATCQAPTPPSCDTNPNPPEIPCRIPCLSGRMHVLVVYYLSKANQNTPWKGRARILRYELPRYDASGTPVPGYVDPGNSDTTFSIWPLT